MDESALVVDKLASVRELTVPGLVLVGSVSVINQHHSTIVVVNVMVVKSLVVDNSQTRVLVPSVALVEVSVHVDGNGVGARSMVHVDLVQVVVGVLVVANVVGVAVRVNGTGQEPVVVGPSQIGVSVVVPVSVQVEPSVGSSGGHQSVVVNSNVPVLAVVGSVNVDVALDVNEHVDLVESVAVELASTKVHVSTIGGQVVPSVVSVTGQLVGVIRLGPGVVMDVRQASRVVKVLVLGSGQRERGEREGENGEFHCW